MRDRIAIRFSQLMLYYEKFWWTNKNYHQIRVSPGEQLWSIRIWWTNDYCRRRTSGLAIFHSKVLTNRPSFIEIRQRILKVRQIQFLLRRLMKIHSKLSLRSIKKARTDANIITVNLMLNKIIEKLVSIIRFSKFCTLNTLRHHI